MPTGPKQPSSRAKAATPRSKASSSAKAAPAAKKPRGVSSKLTKAEREAVNEAKAGKTGHVPSQKAQAVRARHRRRMRELGLPIGRRCGGKNLIGEPCGASPLRPGTEIEGVKVSGDWCINHDPDVPDGAFRRVVQDPGTQAIKSKPKLKRPMEVLADAFAEAPYLLYRRHFETLGLQIDKTTGEITPLEGDAARGATHVGFSREGVARRSKIPHVELQMRAERELMDRLFGRPRQAMELAGSGHGPTVQIPVTIERAQIVSSVLRDAGAIPDLGPAAALPDEE